jgi:PmbA protein
MSLPDGPALLGQCERMVQMALRRGAAQAEAYWEAGSGLDVEIEHDAVAFTGATQAQGGAIRVVADSRLGFAYLTRVEDAEKAIDHALKLARVAPAKGYELPAGGRITAMPGRFDERLVEPDARWVVEQARLLIQGAKQTLPEAVVSGGGVSTGMGVEAIFSSQGVSGYDATTEITLGASLVMEQGNAAISHADQREAHAGKPDAVALGSETAATLASLRKPAAAPKSGALDVLFLPDAVEELLSGLIYSAVQGDDAMRGKTMWSNRLGTEVADERLIIRDDPLHPKAMGVSPFDGEGLAARPVPLIEGGLLRNYLYDSWDAHEHKTRSTHTAVRGSFKARPESGGHHFVAQSAEPRAFEKLVASIDRGVLVSSVLGAHTANDTTGDFSITVPNLWRIKNGAIAGASKEIALSGNMEAMLRSFDGASNTPKASFGARVPAMLFRQLSASS